MNVPPSWNRMGFRNRAAYLCQTRQAKDFKHACELLKGARKPPRPIKPAVSAATQTFWWQS